MSFKEIYTEEVMQLFGQVERKPFAEGESQNRVPQEGALAPLVPFSFSGSGVFDTTLADDVLVYIPDEMLTVVKARLVIWFREFFAPATTAASGGGSTSGASSASSSSSGGSSTPTSSSDSAHSHNLGAGAPGAAGAYTKRGYTDAIGTGFNLETSQASPVVTQGGTPHSHTVTIGGHVHDISHTHSTPNHDHALTYGIYNETFPASHNASIEVYSWTGSAWNLEGTISSLTDDVEDVDLSAYMTVPGKYRIRIFSIPAQPNGGRLGYDMAGHVLGAIQPR